MLLPCNCAGSLVMASFTALRNWWCPEFSSHSKSTAWCRGNCFLTIVSEMPFCKRFTSCCRTLTFSESCTSSGDAEPLMISARWKGPNKSTKHYFRCHAYFFLFVYENKFYFIESNWEDDHPMQSVQFPLHAKHFTLHFYHSIIINYCHRPPPQSNNNNNKTIVIHHQ